MKRTFLSAIIILAVLFLTSCGGGSTETQNTTEQETVKKETVEPAAKSELAIQLELGEKIYNEKCIVCHQADAKGLKGAFPPLAGSDYLLADPIRGVAQTLNGSNEEMIVNGEKYLAPMTPQVQTKEEAVAVINYVLKHFNEYTDDQLLSIEDAKDVVINPMK
ncbi:MAG: cytochrome c [Bacteroidales bacterium]|nr:cytochrome c [Bacteroidales bacterium]MCF8402444.1 cytochrome c [Bacteroidales bacterium]